MNQTFSLNRFGRLLRKYFTDNRGQLLANLGLLAGILLVGALLFYTGLPHQADRNRGISLFFFGWPLWIVFIWQQIEVLNHRERSISYLLQPASQLEKFLLIWLVSGVGFLTVFFLLYTTVDVFGVAYVNGRDWTPDQLKTIRDANGIMSIKPFYQSRYIWPPAQILVLTILLHPFCLAAFFFVKRYSLPIVGVLILGIITAGIFVNSYLAHWIVNTPEPINIMPFEQLSAQSPLNRYDYRRIDLPQPLSNQLRYSVGVIAIVLLYITAYVRLKEREV